MEESGAKIYLFLLQRNRWVNYRSHVFDGTTKALFIAL